MIGPKYIFFLLIAIAILLEVAGDILFKQWALAHKSWVLGIGLALYFIGTVFWAYSLKYEHLSHAISVFTVLNLIVVVLAGVLLFDEKLSRVQTVGIALGVLSVILLEL
jgi:small multidrug resistance pump